jgi:hypothetical protein
MIRMAIQVVFLDDAGKQQGVHEVVEIDRDQLCPAALGLSLADAEQITGGIQQVLGRVQITEWQADHRDCRNRHLLKGPHPIVFRTPFGTLRLDSEWVCACAMQTKGSVSPLAELLQERVSPEMLYLETKFASLVSYGLTVQLMDEILPFDRPIGACSPASFQGRGSAGSRTRLRSEEHSSRRQDGPRTDWAGQRAIGWVAVSPSLRR